MRFVVDSAQGASFSSSSAPQKYQCAADNNNTPLQMAESRGVTVLVTGAAGFIGSHVARYAAESLGMNVVAVDDMSGGFFSNIDVNHERITFVQGDLKDDEFVERLFQEHGPFVYVYHLAAYAAEGMSHFIRKCERTATAIAAATTKSRDTVMAIVAGLMLTPSPLFVNLLLLLLLLSQLPQQSGDFRRFAERSDSL